MTQTTQPCSWTLLKEADKVLNINHLKTETEINMSLLLSLFDNQNKLFDSLNKLNEELNKLDYVPKEKEQIIRDQNKGEKK